MTAAGGALTRRAASAQWSVDPCDGGRLVSLVVDGQELIAQRGDVDLPPASIRYGYGAYPMAPWAGRIRDGILDVDGQTYQLNTRAEPHALHGTTYDRVWEVVASADDGVGLATDLGPDWPFAGEALMTWLSTDAGLHLRLSVLAHERMPVWVGLHPWFLRTLDDGRVADLSIDALEMYARGADGLPTGERIPVPPGPWDDCFTATSAQLTWGHLQLTITASTDTWVVYDERPEAVCIEPQTAPPDALRLGQANWLEAGEEHVLDVDLAWRRLS